MREVQTRQLRAQVRLRRWGIDWFNISWSSKGREPNISCSIVPCAANNWGLNGPMDPFFSSFYLLILFSQVYLKFFSAPARTQRGSTPLERSFATEAQSPGEGNPVQMRHYQSCRGAKVAVENSGGLICFRAAHMTSLIASLIPGMEHRLK